MTLLDGARSSDDNTPERQQALAVAMVAKKVLRSFHTHRVEVQQYRLQEQEERFTIIALDGRGEILTLEGQHLEADLTAEDFEQFQRIKDELPRL